MFSIKKIYRKLSVFHKKDLPKIQNYLPIIIQILASADHTIFAYSANKLMFLIYVDSYFNW